MSKYTNHVVFFLVSTLSFAVFIVCGCLPPKPAPVAPINPKPPAVVVEADVPPLAVSMPESLLATLREVLGPDGSVTFNPASTVTIKRPDVTITTKRGMTFSYKLDEKTGRITFSGEKPIIKVSKAGFTLTPYLTQIDINVDNTGVATVQGDFYTKRQAFDLRTVGEPIEVKDGQEVVPDDPLAPEPDPINNKPAPIDLFQDDTPKVEPIETSEKTTEIKTEVMPVDDRPVVFLYTTPGCIWCRTPKMEFIAGKPLTSVQVNEMYLRNLVFETAQMLPFRIVIKANSEEFPAFITHVPTLHWATKEGSGRMQQGWSGLTEFMKVWMETQSAPK